MSEHLALGEAGLLQHLVRHKPLTLLLFTDKTEDTVTVVAERLLSRGFVAREAATSGKGPTYLITEDGRSAYKDYSTG